MFYVIIINFLWSLKIIKFLDFSQKNFMDTLQIQIYFFFSNTINFVGEFIH